MRMEVEIKVLTLNCWGLVAVSSHRKQRIAAIASHLAESNYDFVFLQEIWTEEDFELICRKTATVLPYTHYFHSGVIGSGVCLLSKSQIVDTSMHKYSLNGYAHKFQHGDWFGGKVVGLCKVVHRGININLYVTHLHAEYDQRHDEYLPHRVAQAFEFSQFVQMTSETADLSIVAGDFNTEPKDLPYRIILNNTCALDAFLTQFDPLLGLRKASEQSLVGTGATCGHPRNSYTTRKELKACSTGKRIDYVLYRTNAGTSVRCISCDSPLDKVPNGGFSYSDHEAVVARLLVSKSIDAPGTCGNEKHRMQCLEEAHALLSKGLRDLRGGHLFYTLMSILCFILIIITIPFHLPYGLNIVLVMVRIMLSILLGFSVWMGEVMLRIERSSLRSACESMEVIIKAMGPNYGACSPTASNPPLFHTAGDMGPLQPNTVDNARFA